ncbi:MAG: hypothetical protein JWR51_2490 [Devosia sp.]|uniref:Ig-like domain-containing protein n=1 Tax=Devosia sp. TaxID=1871048 RepID=UPI00261BE719|nr:Ig-like domain-containing protein [Devosia sp.]MDB5529387.1 hypothetical protein [Devosia sp.]
MTRHFTARFGMGMPSGFLSAAGVIQSLRESVRAWLGQVNAARVRAAFAAILLGLTAPVMLAGAGLVASSTAAQASNVVCTFDATVAGNSGLNLLYFGNSPSGLAADTCSNYSIGPIISTPQSSGKGVWTFAPGGTFGGTKPNDNQIDYTPNPGAVGTDTFTIPAYAENGNTYSFNVTITITAVAPVASDFTASAVAYNTGGAATDISVAGHVINSPTSYAVGSATTANNGLVSVNSSGVVSYTPPTSFRGNDSFTFTATNGGGTSASATVTVPVNDPIITVTPTTFTAGTTGTAYSQRLAPSGGASPYTFSTTLASGALPAGMSLSGSGVVSGTPTETGSFTFTVTGTDNSVGTGHATFTSSTIALTITALTITALTITISPGTLPDAAAGGDYNRTLTASGGSAPYRYSITADALPNGMTLSPEGVLSGSPQSVGRFDFTVTATDSSTSTLSGSQSYSITVTEDALILGNVTVGVPGDSSNNAIVVSVTGSNSGTTFVATQPAHGTATRQDATIFNYTPTPGYYGPDSFTYGANTPFGTVSVPATVTINIAPPAAPVVTGTSASTPFATPVAINLSGFITGVRSSISIGAAPAHGTTSVAGEIVTYTPAAGYFGTDSFTYTATGPGGTSASATVGVTVGAPAAPVAAAASASVPHNTAQAINLAGSITGVHTSIAVGVVPAHGATSVAGDVVTYTPAAGYSGADSFTYTATGPGGTSAAATVSLTVASGAVFTPAPGPLANAMAGEHYSQTISVMDGTGYTVSGGTSPSGLMLGSAGTLEGTLAAGSAGTYHFTVTANIGGFPASASYELIVLPSAVTAADKVVTIQPGATPLPVDLTAGATGGPFVDAIVGTVTPPQAGTAEIIMGDVASIDSVWSHKFYLKFHPNPAYSGTVLVGYTLIGATGSSSATVQFIASLDANGVANNFDHLIKDFVQARASLLANGVDTPGLRQRRGMGAGTSPGVVNISPSDSSVTMNFASSLAQLRSWGEAGDAAGALAQSDPAEAMPFNFWIDGTATLHLRSDDGDEHWGRFALVSVGGDYLVNDKLLVGLALHADFMDDIADTTTIEGTGVLIGPYVSAEIVDGVFLDASVYYGHSWNDVDTSIFDGSFETERLLAKASLEGQWALTEALTLRPKATAFYLREATGQYTVTDGLGSAITVAGFTTDQLRLSAGGTLEYTMSLGEGLSITPYLGAQLGLSLSHHDEATVFTALSTGFDLTGLGSWTLGGAIEADLESDGLKAVSAKANLSAGF